MLGGHDNDHWAVVFSWGMSVRESLDVGGNSVGRATSLVDHDRCILNYETM